MSLPGSEIRVLCDDKTGLLHWNDEEVEVIRLVSLG